MAYNRHGKLSPVGELFWLWVIFWPFILGAKFVCLIIKVLLKLILAGPVIIATIVEWIVKLFTYLFDLAAPYFADSD